MADDGGLAKFQRRMGAVPVAVRKAVGPALVKQADAMASTMQTLVPVDTGDTRSSIHVTGPGEQTPAYSQPGGSMTVPENMAAVTVGNTNVRTAHLVEYGTSKTDAQPFFWPAVRMHQKKATTAIKRAIAKAVRESAK